MRRPSEGVVEIRGSGVEWRGVCSARVVGVAQTAGACDARGLPADLAPAALITAADGGSVRPEGSVHLEIPTLHGEAVMQVHSPGASCDGSADTGVGKSFRDGEWRTFGFGPGATEPAEGTFSTDLDGTDRIHDLVGLEGPMENRPIRDSIASAHALSR